MGKVYRQDRKTVQRIKARDIVPGDIVEVAGRPSCFCASCGQTWLCCFPQRFGGAGACVACTCLGLGFSLDWPSISHELAENFNLDASVVGLKKILCFLEISACIIECVLNR